MEGLKKIPKSNITPGKLIGQGGFGNVLKGEYCKGEIVALKILHTPVRAEKYHEFNVMSQFKHRNLVALIGIVDNETNACPELLFKYLPNGNLLEFVEKNDCSKKTLTKIACDIVNGMEYLHNLHYPHRTLAARNILMDANCHAKISDYGISIVLDGQGSNYYKLDDDQVLPIRWVPKECIPSKSNTDSSAAGSCNFKADVWSFGVLLWEACSKGDVPYGAASSNSQVRQIILNGSNPLKEKRPDKCPAAFIRIMESIFVDCDERPTFMDLRKTFDMMHENQNKKQSKPKESKEDGDVKNNAPPSGRKKKWKSKPDEESEKSESKASESEATGAEGDMKDQLPKSNPIPERDTNRFNKPRPSNHPYKQQNKFYDRRGDKQIQFVGHRDGRSNFNPKFQDKDQSQRQGNYNRDFRPNFSHSADNKSSSFTHSSESSNSGNYSQQHRMPPPPLLNQPNYFPTQMPMMNNPNPAMMNPYSSQPHMGMGFNPMQMPQMYPQSQMSQAPFPQSTMPLQVTVNQGGPQSNTDKGLEEQVKHLQETVRKLETMHLESNKGSSQQYGEAPWIPKSSQRFEKDRNFSDNQSSGPGHENRRDFHQTQQPRRDNFANVGKGEKVWIPGNQQSQPHQQNTRRERHYQSHDQAGRQYSNSRNQNQQSSYRQNNNEATNKIVGDVTAAAVSAAVKGALKASKNSTNKSDNKNID